MKKYNAAIIALLVLPLAACGLPGAGVASIPKQPFRSAAIDSITSRYADALDQSGQAKQGSWLAKLEECAVAVETKGSDASQLANCKSFRNNMIAELQLAIDYNFNAYTGNILAGRAKTGFYVGGVRSGLETGATLIGGEGVKTVLSSLAALTGTLQASANEQFYYEQTGPALIQSMEASRKLVFAEILRKQMQPYEKYPIASAVNDLNTYYRAGTVAGAISKLQKEAVKSDVAADARIACVSKAKDIDSANKCPDGSGVTTVVINQMAEQDE